MAEGYFHRLNSMTNTRAWINNPTQEEVQIALEAGIVNCTTNPTFVMKQLYREPKLINPIIERICCEESNDSRAAALIQRECVKQIMQLFMPVFDENTRMSGLVSLQGDPMLEDDPQIIINEALECRSLGRNYLAKIPTTKAGIEAMEVLIREDVPLIATEIMSISQTVVVCETYKHISQESGKSPPFFVTCIAGIFDDHIQHVIKQQNIDISSDIAFQAGTVLARKQYRLFQERKYPGTILGGGARGLHHFTEFVGGNMSITINWKNMAETLVNQNPPIIERIDTAIPDYVIEHLTNNIPDFRLAWEEEALSLEKYEAYGPVQLFRRAFIDGWNFLLEEVKKRR